MLIPWIIVLFGVNAGSCLMLQNGSTATPQNSTTNFLKSKYNLQKSVKPKHQLDKFDSSTFNDPPSIFPAKKITGLNAFNDNQVKDVSEFVPSASLKVARSNSEIIGTHGKNYGSPNLPALSYLSSPQRASQATNSQANLYSNENSEALSQVRQTETAYNNQVITPLYIDSYVTHPKHSAAKSSAISSGRQYEVPAKVQFDPYSTLSEIAPHISVYGPIAHVSSHSIVPNNHYEVQQSAQSFKNIHPSSKVYAPLHAYNQQQQYDTQFQNYAYNPYDNFQYATSSGLELNNKKLKFPVIQLQTAQNYPGYIQALETTPLILNSGTHLKFKENPGFGPSYEFNKFKNSHPNQRSGNNSPFLGVGSPIQVLPVQTASSTAQFPKFKGASISQFPSRGFSKIPNDYQEFKLQPQLHFNANTNINTKSYHQPAFYTKPLEKIKTDVEIIDKKKPIPPLPKTDDEDDDETNDDDSGEGFKNTDSYFPKNDDDDYDVATLPKKYFRESEFEGDFQPSKSYPFDEYDDKFGKQKKIKVHDTDDDNDDDDANINLAAKYRYVAKSEDDDDDDNDESDSAEDEPKSKYKAYPLHKNFRKNKNRGYDKDKEETQKQEKREKILVREQQSPRKSKGHKERSKSYLDEFDESFRKKPNKLRHSYRNSQDSKAFKKSNERPRTSASYSASKSPKRNLHRAYRDESGESSSRPLSPPGPIRQTFKRDYRSEESNKTKEAINIQSPQVVWKDSSGMRVNNPGDDTLRSSYSKEEAAVINGYRNTRKPSATFTQELITKTLNKSTKLPSQNDDKLGITMFNPHGSWNPAVTKNKPITNESYSKSPGLGLKALVNPKQNYFSPLLGQGEVFRSLKGV